MADYILELTIKEAYLANALDYIPKALDLPEDATQAEKIEAFRQWLYNQGRRLYVQGSRVAKDLEAAALQDAAQIESIEAFTD